jgi:dethiobiotin synthetase
MAADLFVTGTDTNVGKTVLSALLVAALDATYWKPIQTGSSEGTDRQTVMRWAELPEERAARECYCFEPPVSPHLAAEASGVTIRLERICRPSIGVAANRPLIAEGAGGVLVPINDSQTMLDLMRHLAMPVVVASRSALGTINHTLLTVKALRDAGVEIRGVVMIGKENRDNERAVERYGAVPIAGRIPLLETIDRSALLRTFRDNFEAQHFQ